MNEPFEPDVTMFFTLLLSLRLFCARVPAVSRALLSTRLTLFSNDSSIVRPGWHSSSFFCARSTKPFTSFFDSSIVRTMSSIVFASAIVSPMPIEYERWRIQWLITRCHAPMKARAAVGPCSFMIVWISPPLDDLPIVATSIMPARSWPESITTTVSVGESSSSSSGCACAGSGGRG